ncbi:MAG: hypothetical protein JSU94_14720 [Phycisphaerales bacterium]|nr:MAG: hypothetical protein JSU94_14720 [Phycisphaerales bacterium]
MGCLSWYFSSRRHALVRLFVPPEERREALRSLSKGRAFVKGLRAIAILEFIVAALVSLAALIEWLVF